VYGKAGHHSGHRERLRLARKNASHTPIYYPDGKRSGTPRRPARRPQRRRTLLPPNPADRRYFRYAQGSTASRPSLMAIGFLPCSVGRIPASSLPARAGRGHGIGRSAEAGTMIPADSACGGERKGKEKGSESRLFFSHGGEESTAGMACFRTRRRVCQAQINSLPTVLCSPARPRQGQTGDCTDLAFMLAALMQPRLPHLPC
jgi:hypothetical protein